MMLSDESSVVPDKPFPTILNGMSDVYESQESKSCICNSVSKPVCGANRQTYINSCMAKCRLVIDLNKISNKYRY